MKTIENRYKFFLPVLAIMTALVLLAGTASAQTAPDGALSLANLVVSPQPVLAGENITISFQLYNSYADVLQNVDVGLEGGYPLLNYSPADTDLIDSIGTGLYGGTTYLIYHLHVPKNVKAGNYTVDVFATYEAQSGSTTDVPGTSTMPITVYISGSPQIVLNANPTNAIVPGQAFGVQINALDTGTGQANNVTINVQNSKNFSVVGANSFYLGTINAQGTSTETVELQAAQHFTATNGTIPVTLDYQLTNGTIISSNVLLTVSVIVNKPNIVATIVSATPQSLYAGSNQTLTVQLENVGTGTAKNVTLSFPQNPNITVGSSASEDFVGTLQAGASTTESIFIIANRNDTMTSYSLPLRISYANANYQNTTNKTVNLGINLESAAIFNVTSVTDTLQPGQTYVPVVVTIKNIGNEAAEHLTLSLQTIYPIAPVNTNGYINALAPGQSANVTFYVNVEQQGNAGQYPMTLYEQWTQPNGATNQQYSSSTNYALPVYTSGSGSGSDLTYAVIAVIVVIGAIFVYRRRGMMKASKKEKK